MKEPKQATIEQRFIKWAEARDDDWWENGEGHFSIWDFRTMQEFFNLELDSLAQEVEGLKKDKEWHFSTEEYGCSHCNFNAAIDSVLDLIQKRRGE